MSTRKFQEDGKKNEKKAYITRGDQGKEKPLMHLKTAATGD